MCITISASATAVEDKPVKLWEVLLEEAKYLGFNVESLEKRARSADDDEKALKIVQNGLAGLKDQEGSELTALCLSGGGIRSATFCLGVLQGLVKAGLFSKFHYLSTVSGGGYIGAWLSAWKTRVGNDEVMEQLNAQHDAVPISHLRRYSNYLAPKLGLFSVDSWTLIAIFVRNLVLNWAVLAPMLFAVVLIPKIFIAVLELNPPAGLNHWSSTLGWIGFPLLLVCAMAYLAFLPGVGKLRMDKWKFWCFVFIPSVLSVLVISTGIYWAKPSRADVVSEATGLTLAGLSALFILIVELAIVATWYVRDKQDASRRDGREKQPLRFSHDVLVPGMVTSIVTSILLGVLLYIWSTIIVNPNDPAAVKAFACFGPSSFWLTLLGTQFAFMGLHSRIMTDDDREWWARLQAWFLIVICAWTFFSGLVIYGPPLVDKLLHSINLFPVFLLTFSVGALSALLGYSSRSPARSQQLQENTVTTLLRIALGITALVFVALIAVWFSTLVSKFFGSASLWEMLLGFAGLLGISSFFARYINVNRFSLHSMYRNRLIRAYLGASAKRKRERDWFTGFTADDNIDLYKLGEPEKQKPLHIINAALNIVGGDQLAWQERKAASFTFSPLHCGSHCPSSSIKNAESERARRGNEIGYRRTPFYGGPKEGVSLGTAMAISGAAVSPSRGYHSSPLLGFIMMLFNARLGWWLGNPSLSSKGKHVQDGPYTLKPFLWEMFGLSDADKDWIHLSDGGHFENLGLYEMIVRRCRSIVVCDGGADPNYVFDDLGNAIRKIRADFGISIEVEGEMKIAASENAQYWTVCTIKYSDIDPNSENGRLLYIKPALCGNEPMDVYNYSCKDKTFPHQATSDQFFGESQFESYRALGRHIIGLLTVKPHKSIRELIDFAVTYLRPSADNAGDSEADVASNVIARLSTIDIYEHGAATQNRFDCSITDPSGV